MAKGPRYRLAYRRRRQGKTNYKKRLKMLLGKRDRIVYRKTNKYIIGQLIRYNPQGDNVLLSVHSRILEKYGWEGSMKNTPAAYLTGYLLGKKIVANKDLAQKEYILDIGLLTSRKGIKAYAFAKGIIDAGVNLLVNQEMFPSQERISGQHISKQEIFKKVRQALEEQDGRA